MGVSHEVTMMPAQKLTKRVRAVVQDASDLHRSALLALAVKICASALGFGSQILLAQLLGQEQYGLYSYFWVWIMIGGIMTGLGYSEAATRFIAQYRDTGEYGLGWGFIASTLTTVIALSFSVAIMGIILANLFAGQLPDGYLILICLALACLPIFAVQDMMEGFSLAFSWTGLAHIPPYIVRQLCIMLFVAGLIGLSFPATAQTALVAAIFATALATSCQFFIFMRRARKALPLAPREMKRRYWAKTAFPMLLANGFQICLTFSDVIILGLFLDSASIALYFAATRISSQVTSVQFAVTSAIAQRMSGLNATQNIEDLHKLIQSSARWIFWPTLAVTLGVLAVGWPLLWLFGSQFTAAYPLLPILVLGALARASTGGAEDALKMVGHERPEFAAKAGATILNLILNFSLVPWLGIYGAAIATTASLIFYAITIEVMVRRLIGTSSFIGTLERRI